MKMQGLCEKELRVRSLYDMDNKKGFTMKTKEELNALKERIETLSKELRALSDEELEYVTGGVTPPVILQKIDDYFPHNGTHILNISTYL